MKEYIITIDTVDKVQLMTKMRIGVLGWSTIKNFGDEKGFFTTTCPRSFLGINMLVVENQNRIKVLLVSVNGFHRLPFWGKHL